MDDVFKNKHYKSILAVICAVGWSLAYPLIKVGYSEFAISSDDPGSKILFAGIRFLLAGVLVSAFCIFKKTHLSMKRKGDISWLLLLALVNTTLHYMFAYIGLSNNSSGRSTILDSMNGFFLIFLSAFFFKDDKLDARKMIGCVMGLTGIVLINIDPNSGFFDNVSFGGDGMILLNALCGAFGGVITRIASRKMDIITATGYSMAIGGALLVLTSICIGIDAPWKICFGGVLVMLILVLISAVCFVIYNKLLSFHPISEIAIYNALIPVLGVIFAALILNEPFKWQYIISVLLVAAGIRIVNKKTKAHDIGNNI